MKNNKDKVYKTYDKITDWFDKHRSRELFEKNWLDKAMARLNPGAAILDLGCGMGEPIAKYFIEKGYNVTGIDGCKEFIEMAKARLPQGNFFKTDMKKLRLDKIFDLVIAWNSLFHLNADDQRKMFSIFASHLHKNGLLIFTSGSEAGEVWSNNGGEDLYHASLSPDEYKSLLGQHGFTLIEHKISDPECGDATIWFARLISKKISNL